MIKRTLYFGNPAYLSLKNEQLLLKLPEVEKNDTMPEFLKAQAVRSIPIEDIGIVVLDHKQITISQGLLEKLLENNCAVITCNSSRMPVGLLLPLCGNSLQTERFRNQIEAAVPLKKQLWQQTVSRKIENQAAVLSRQCHTEVGNMLSWASQVRSGDSDNLEARAASYYWKNAFPSIPAFCRDREGIYPNDLLNYGYAILRAIIARALVCSGLLPTFGIFHRNKYNAYCLADDIMEPYRPFVDQLVMQKIKQYPKCIELTQEIKVELLGIPLIEVTMQGKRSPLSVAATLTTSSLQKCYAGDIRKIVYPEISNGQI